MASVGDIMDDSVSLIVIRHGESDANRCGIISDKNVDHELTSVGIQQAEETAKLLKNERLNSIFSSSRQRARRTAEIINVHHKLDIIVRDDLIERDFGVLGGTPIKNAQWRMNKENFTWIDIPESESFGDIDFRIGKFLQFLAKNHRSSRVLVSTHDDIVKSFHRLIQGVSAENSVAIKVSNSEPHYFNWQCATPYNNGLQLMRRPCGAPPS